MKISKYFLMAAAAMSLFACSNDDEVGLNKKDSDNVMITLSLGKASTRENVETIDGKYNNVLDLRVEFFTGDGRNLNVDVPQSLLDAAVAELQKSESDGGNHTAKIVIPGVPKPAAKIAVIANENTTIQTGSLNLAWNTDIYLTGLVERATEEGSPKVTFNQQNSLMTGVADIDDSELTEDGNVAVTVNIKPVSSRLEVAKLTAQKVEGTPEQPVVNIENFSVAGIFINRFYTQGKLDPDKNPDDRPKVSHESDVNNYTKAHYAICEGAGNKGDYHFMCDDYTDAPITGNNTNLTGIDIWQVTPTTGCWGYPVLAGKQKIEEGEGETAKYDVAHIIIKLNVAIEGIAGTKTKYLTIIGYKDKSGQKITKFERGKVYYMENIEFNIYNLTDVPYEGDKTVEATVRVLPWEAVPVTPEIR